MADESYYLTPQDLRVEPEKEVRMTEEIIRQKSRSPQSLLSLLSEENNRTPVNVGVNEAFINSKYDTMREGYVNIDNGCPVGLRHKDIILHATTGRHFRLNTAAYRFEVVDQPYSFLVDKRKKKYVCVNIAVLHLIHKPLPSLLINGDSQNTETGETVMRKERYMTNIEWVKRPMISWDENVSGTVVESTQEWNYIVGENNTQGQQLLKTENLQPSLTNYLVDPADETIIDNPNIGWQNQEIGETDPEIQKMYETYANRAEMQKQIKKASMSLDSVGKKIDFEALRIIPPEQEDSNIQ